MSGVMNCFWLNEDCRDYFACVRYVLFRCCKKTQKYKLGKDVEGWSKSFMTEYKPIDYMDFKWIMDRCNFLLAKDHGVELLPNSFLSWYEDAHFVPEYFEVDFSCDYKKLKNGKLKKVQSNNEESDFISGADMWAMNKIIRRWKIYGRWFVKLDNFWWKLKWKFRKNKLEQ